MWLALQQDIPNDYVIATGEAHTVREFAELAFRYAGYELRFDGDGVTEVGIDIETKRVLVRVNTSLFRTAEIDVFIGNPARARRVLGWRSEVTFKQLVYRMTEHDVNIL
jgi:GDPmannose 4,6-dehydratase